MESCNAIIASKDELISDFQLQLRGKDEEYVRTLRQQAEDIDSLISRIRKEFKVIAFLFYFYLRNIEIDKSAIRNSKANMRRSWT